MSEGWLQRGPRLGRRTILAAGAGVGLAALAGCGSGGSPSGPSGDVGTYTPPTQVPLEGVKPEFPAGKGGVPAGFTRLPDPLVERNVKLPEIEPITMMLQGAPPTVPFDRNTYYQQLSAAVGAEFDITWALLAEYIDKFQVTIAGDDLPDIVMIDKVPQLPKLLEAKFTDLTDFLSGDNIAEFPGLASMPSAAWEVPVVEGRLWGVSRPRPARDGMVMLGRGDQLEKAGVGRVPKLSDGDDFLALMQELSNGKNQFAMGADPVSWLLRALLEMFGSPNNWREKDGVWTHAYESPEMEAALEQATKLWSDRCLHPSSITQSGQNLVWWRAKTTALFLENGVAGWTSRALADPEWDVQGFVLPQWDGGGPATKHLGAGGYPYFSAIRKQSSPDRVREILRVMDFIASPFGTQEWLTTNYGQEGKHYSVKDGLPATTEIRAQEAFGIGYIGSQAAAQLFVPGRKEVVERQHQWLTEVLPSGEADASRGLYSETALGKGLTASRLVTDAQYAIIQGRQPLSEWGEVVAEWRKSAGDAIREEYAKAAEEAG